MVLNRIGTTLFVTVDRDTTATTFTDVGRTVAAEVHRHHDRRLVIDLGAVEVLDADDVEVITRVSRSIRLMGADVVVVGLRPEVVMAITLAGADFDGITCALDVGRAAAMERASA